MFLRSFIALLALIVSSQALASEPTSVQLLNYFVLPAAHVPVPTASPNVDAIVRSDALRFSDERAVVKLNVTEDFSFRFGGKQTVNQLLEKAKELELTPADINRNTARSFVASRMELRYQIRF